MKIIEIGGTSVGGRTYASGKGLDHIWDQPKIVVLSASFRYENASLGSEEALAFAWPYGLQNQKSDWIGMPIILSFYPSC